MSKKAKLLGVLLSSAIALGSMQPVAANDLDGHWAKNIILEMQSKNIISGYADGTFKPNEQMTRAEFIKVVNRAFGFKGNSDQKFTDVTPEDWFAGEVATAYANGYLKGFPDGSFKPNAVISRVEVAVILSRILKIEDDAAAADQFTDSASIPAWAKGSIGALAKAGYLKGYPDGSFGFDKNITRSEAFAFVYTPSNDYVAKQEQMKKEEAKKKAEAKKKEAEKTKTPPSSSSPSGNSYTPSPSPSPSPSPQPPIEQKKVKTISFTPADFNITSENGKLTIQVVYDPADASDKGVTWELKEGMAFVAIESQTKDSITLKALDNGNYKVQATLTANHQVMNHFSGTVSNQVVSVSGVGTPADKAITGLSSERIYAVEVDGKYFAVNADGKLGHAYSTMDEATLASVKLNAGVTAITDLNNTKHYIVTDVTDVINAHFINKVKAYIALDVATITLKNMKETEEKGNALDAEIQAKLAEWQNQGNHKLKEELNDLYTNQFLPKKQQIAAKIQSLRVELLQKVELVKIQLHLILPGLSPDRADNIISTVEQYKKDMPAETWESIPNKEKFDTLVAEVEKYKLFATQTVSINEIGGIDLSGSNGSVFTVDWELIKIKNGNQLETLERGNNSSTDIPNQLHALRKAGLGNYKAKLTLKSQYLENQSLESELKEVKRLSNDLGALELDANLKPKSNTQNPQSSKVRFNLAGGYLEWDAVENATSYDVRAEITETSREGNIGGEYLNSSEENDNFNNMENEFEKSSLSRPNNKWFALEGKKSERVFVAIGLEHPKVELSKFVPYTNSTGFSPDEGNIENDDSVTIFLKVWIIPRNEQSLYLSEMKKYLGIENPSPAANFIVDSVSFPKFLKEFKILN